MTQIGTDFPDRATAQEREAQEIARRLEEFRSQARNVSSDQEAREVTRRVAGLVRRYRARYQVGLPPSPIEQAKAVHANYRTRPHIELMSNRILSAVQDVEAGQDRRMTISVPPRSGKSTIVSVYSVLWMLRRHPEWPIMMTSYDDGLVTDWARQIRRMIEDHPELGVELERDGGAGGRWSTVEGGGVYATGIGGAITGRGAKVMFIDDPHSDFASAHNPKSRQRLWDWWTGTAATRLEPPSLVCAVATRWHEDDFIGRLLSDEYEGDPDEWEQVTLPALAEDTEADPLGRAPGEPLISPLVEENADQAIARWYGLKNQVGSYTFASQYQQRPNPPKGAIFNTEWWRFWTVNPDRATEDGRVVYLDPATLDHARWIDSWDLAFEGGDSSDFVVGQRWVRYQANRYLIAQSRGRWTFTESLKQMERWAQHPQWDDPTDPRHHQSPYGYFVHQRLIEKKANGAAAINVLKDKIGGLKPVNPRTSKELRARAVTPEIESGNVYLPHPSDPGNEWVQDLLSEMRAFPHGENDDMVDTLTQALNELRGEQRGGITNPARLTPPDRLSELEREAAGEKPRPLSRRMERSVTKAARSAAKRR